jgi:alkanesulfonate monooxygenase SsuD/methylene tetrahydromethanopterin reductase-like flavin-dependent oxidoreductase (luciferase family)
VILPEHPWSVAGPVWQRAEALGFAHAWTYDHLAWRSFRDDPWFGAVPTLTAAAAATERIRLGTLVASPTFRHPVPFAKEIVALDDISGGRFTLGIGAGAAGGWDATMLGGPAWSLAERADRFAEFVELTDRLLREPATTYAGRWYSADEARTYPGCVQAPRVPFTIAATGPRGMRLAAQYGDAWVTTGGHTDDTLDAEAGARLVAEQMGRLDDACAAIGRDPASLDRLVLTGPTLAPGVGSVEEFAETSGRYGDVGVTDLVVHWPRPTPPYAADLATFERIFST